MNRILCVAVVLSGALLSWPASAGMSEGVAAVYAGERLIGVADVAAYVASPRRTIATGTDRGSNPVEK